MSDLLARVEALVAKWQPRLHLEGHRIFAEIGELAKHEGARLDTDWRAGASVLTIPLDYAERQRAGCKWRAHQTDDDLLEDTVVHELLHACEHPIAGQFEQEFESYMGDGVVTSACRDLWRDYREMWIDHLTRVLLEADRGAWDDQGTGTGVLTRDDALFKIIGLGAKAPNNGQPVHSA